MAEPVIISSGYTSTIKDIVDIVANIIGFKGKVMWGGEKDVGQKEKYSDNSKILGILGDDFKFTGIEEGIEFTTKWYMENVRFIQD